MTITSKNYYATIEKVDRGKLHADLKATADFVDEITGNGGSWELYEQDQDIQETVDLFFEKLGDYLEEHPVKASNPEKPVKSSSEKRDVTHKPEKGRARKSSVKSQMKVVSRSGEPVERISEEIRFLKRFTLLNGKVKTRDQIRSFLNSLQRAMAEKRIRKTSSYAKQILGIQDSLIDLIEKFKRKENIRVEIESSRLASLQSVCGKQELMLSVRFIKSYIGMQGKVIANNKAKNLYNRVAKAINAVRITDKDPYFPIITEMLNTLESFVKKNPSEGILVIPTRELNGLDEFAEDEIGGLGYLPIIPDNRIVKGRELFEMDFPEIGFTGKWLDFFGNPSPGFSIMVSALPKFGKSTLCIEFADYLSRNHGEVLYVCKEERVGRTLKQKALQSDADEVNFVGTLPDDLSSYDFIFLDSVTKLGLSIRDLDSLRRRYPDKSFIFIFQTTKQGIFRGGNGFQHDVDMIVELPRRGFAIQYGRYNPHAEMQLVLQDN